MSTKPLTFKAWMKANLSDYLEDIANYGASAGFPYITYYRDTSEIYETFSTEIWEQLDQDVEELGYKNVFDMMQHWGSANSCHSDASFKCLLVWYMAERVAYELVENEE
ncbi:MAG: hypothetical protein KDE51_01480 [Anaerolineales bacterium]|nr:hypothetical protein [Anaerolineales bacterium]